MQGRDPSVPDRLLDAPSWSPRWMPSVDDPRALRLLRWCASAVFMVGLGACVVRGADGPADPRLDPSTTIATVPDPSGSGLGPGAAPEPPSSAAGRALLASFGSILVDLVTSSGEILALCLLHADEPAERSRGLMDVSDLGGFDGMLFSHAAPVQSQFFMFQTPTPLTLGWFDADGASLGSVDMDPCLAEDSAVCERFPAPGRFTDAIEVPRGAPASAAFTSGTSLRRNGACTPT